MGTVYRAIVEIYRNPSLHYRGGWDDVAVVDLYKDYELAEALSDCGSKRWPYNKERGQKGLQKAPFALSSRAANIHDNDFGDTYMMVDVAQYRAAIGKLADPSNNSVALLAFCESLQSADRQVRILIYGS